MYTRFPIATKVRRNVESAGQPARLEHVILIFHECKCNKNFSITKIFLNFFLHFFFQTSILQTPCFFFIYKCINPYHFFATFLPAQTRLSTFPIQFTLCAYLPNYILQKSEKRRAKIYVFVLQFLQSYSVRFPLTQQ